MFGEKAVQNTSDLDLEDQAKSFIERNFSVENIFSVRSYQELSSVPVLQNRISK